MGPIAAIVQYSRDVRRRRSAQTEAQRAWLRRYSGSEWSWLQSMLENPGGGPRRRSRSRAEDEHLQAPPSSE